MTFGPVVNARYFTEDIPILAAPPSASRSMSTATTRTRDPELDMELEASFIAKPAEDNLFQRIRASRSEISSAKLKMYHELCNKRLENTMHMFRVREERERVAVSRGNKKQRVGSDAGTALSPSTNFEARDRQWKLIRESNDVRVYRHMRRKQHTSTMMASGTIHGSLNDVMNGLYADTTKDSQVLHTLLSNKFLDAGVLHVDRCGDDQEQFQFSGITWTALKTPGLFFCKNRDFLSFKKMDCFKDDYGDEFGYLVLHSIEPTDECSKAISSKASRYVRGFISIGILFKKQADDLVSMYMHGEFNPKGRISSSFGDTCFANSIIALANTAQSGQAKNLSMLLHSFSAAPGAMATHLFSKPGKEKDLCGVCARSMFFWDSPQQCRGCWQRVCRSCRVKKPIFCDHYHRAHQGKKSQAPCMESFCLQCVASVIPSGVQTKAKLLKQLEKKRKRSSVSGHRQTISSSITESAVRPAYQASIGIPDDNSSISAMSFQESEKHQQHRLSLTRGPAGRRTPRPRLSSMVDVVEHFEIQNNNFKPYNNNNVSAGASSSIPSLISFSSNDAGTISDYGVALTASSNNRDGADFRVGSRQYHVDVLAAGLKRDQPARAGGSNVANLRAARPPRTEEYYQKVLQRYLRSNKSFISMNSNISSALTNGSSNHNALTDREDVSTVRSVVDSVSSGSAASVATADLYFKHL